MFGEDLKYVLAVTILAGMAYMTPSVHAALKGSAPVQSSSIVALIDESSNVAAASMAVAQKKPSSANSKCPLGYTCYLNPVPVTDVTAQVNAQPKIELIYDANKKEAQLVATFRVVVEGGSKGVYVYQYAPANFINQSTNYSFGNSQIGLMPITKVATVKDVYGNKLFVIPAGKKIEFQDISSVDPKQMFSGTYYAKLEYLFMTTNPQDGYGHGFPVSGKTQTGTKTIVGEVSPFLTSLDTPSPLVIGQEVHVSGQHLSGVSLYIDGAPAPTPISTVSNESQFIFVLPSLSSGWHWLSVQNSNGMSNSIQFEVTGGIPKAELVIIESPVNSPFITYQTNNNILGQISLTANNSEVKLGDITVFGEPSTATPPLNPFYLYDGPTMLGKVSVDTTNYQQFSNYIVTIPAQINIPAGTTKTLTLRADAANLGTTSIRMTSGIGGQGGADFSVVFDPNSKLNSFVVAQ